MTLLFSLSFGITLIVWTPNLWLWYWYGETREPPAKPYQYCWREAEDYLRVPPETKMNTLVLSQCEREVLGQFFLIAFTVVFSMVVATAEMTIRYNKLTPQTELTLPGQFIPMVVGIAKLLDAVILVVRCSTARSYEED